MVIILVCLLGSVTANDDTSVVQSSLHRDVPGNVVQSIIDAAVNNVHNANTHTHNNVSQTGGVLKRNWRSGNVFTELGKQIQAAQNPADCTKAKYARYDFESTGGMGANLRLWASALRSATKANRILLTNPAWQYLDTEFCVDAQSTAFECYFGPETSCPIPPADQLRSNDSGKVNKFSWRPMEGGSDHAWFDESGETMLPYKFAAMEYLFRSIPQRILAKAEAAAAQIFGSTIDPNMITVHIRWADKFHEYAQLDVRAYIDAVNSLAKEHNLGEDLTIYLTTDDPRALDEFQSAAPKTWTVTYIAEAVPGPNNGSMYSAQQESKKTGGTNGLNSVITLLLALESKYYVLATSSNWSTLIDFLRQVKVDRECGNCTDVRDLSPVTVEGV